MMATIERYAPTSDDIFVLTLGPDTPPDSAWVVALGEVVAPARFVVLPHGATLSRLSDDEKATLFEGSA